MSATVGDTRLLRLIILTVCRNDELLGHPYMGLPSPKVLRSDEGTVSSFQLTTKHN
jgi:hypothetical protein